MLEFNHGLPHPLQGQRYRDYTRQRQYRTNDILLENRIIFFGSVGGNVYEPVITDMTANARHPADAVICNTKTAVRRSTFTSIRRAAR